MFLCVTGRVVHDVFKDCVASTFKVRQFKVTCTLTQHHISEELYPQHHCCGNFTCHMHGFVTGTVTVQIINCPFYELLNGRTRCIYLELQIQIVTVMQT